MSAKKTLTQAPGHWYFRFVKSLRYMAGGFFLSLSCLLAVLVSSGWASKYAGEFLSVGVGARPMGMGGAFAAISDDASAIYWNPAGLARLPQRQVLFMHAESFGGLVRHDFLGVGLPLRTAHSALGMGLLRLGVEEIPYTEWDPETHRPRVLKEVNDSEVALYFSYTRSLQEKLSLGGSAKIIRKSVGDDHAWGLGVDAGVHWQPRSRWLVGAKLADITSTPLAWSSGHRETILPLLKVGTAYRLAPGFLRGEILVAMDVDTRFEGRDVAAWTSLGGVSFDPRAGLEYKYRGRLALRLGVQPEQFSAGAGIRLGIGGVDYAFLGHDDLDSSHRLSASLDF